MGFVDTIKEKAEDILFDVTDSTMFDRNRAAVDVANCTMMQEVSVIGILLLIKVAITYALATGISGSTIVYFLFLITLLVAFIVSSVYKRRAYTLPILAVYIFLAAVLVLAIILGVFLSPKSATTAFIALLVLLPLFVTDQPWRVSAFIAGFCLVFCVCTLIYKDTAYSLNDIFNCIVFTIIGVAAAHNVCTLRLENLDNRRQLAELRSQG